MQKTSSSKTSPSENMVHECIFNVTVLEVVDPKGGDRLYVGDGTFAEDVADQHVEF